MLGKKALSFGLSSCSQSTCLALAGEEEEEEESGRREASARQSRREALAHQGRLGHPAAGAAPLPEHPAAAVGGEARQHRSPSALE